MYLNCSHIASSNKCYPRSHKNVSLDFARRQQQTFSAHCVRFREHSEGQQISSHFPTTSRARNFSPISMLISYALYEDYPRINTQIAYIYTCNGYLHMKFNELVSSAVGHSSANGGLGDFFLTRSRTSNARLVSSRIQHMYKYIDYRSRGNCYQSRKNFDAE